jgi:GntR family transcriptional regulator
VEDRYLARAVAVRLRLSDLRVPSLLATLARAHGLTVDRARVRIGARGASRDEARLLNLRPGAPLLAAEFAVLADGRPAQVVRAQFRPDRYAFVFTVSPEAPLRQDHSAPDTRSVSE